MGSDSKGHPRQASSDSSAASAMGDSLPFAKLAVHHIRARNGEYRGASYHVVASPETLVRMGLARSAPTKTGITPRGIERRNGLVCLDVFSDVAIARDTAFREAMGRVLYGMPCPQFEFPRTRPRRSRPL